MSRIPGAIVLAIALLLLVTPAGLYAQRGSHSGGGAAAGHIAVHASTAPSFAPRPAQGFSAPAFHRPIVRPQRPIIVTQPFGFYPSYGYSPYFYSTPAGAPYAYGDPAYAYADPAYTQSYGAVTQAPALSPNEADLSYQVGVLSQQIEQLRQEQAQRALPPAPARSAAPAVLVFRDGHRLEIENYAIVGNTIWVLDEKSSTKISIADLDLDATQNENRSHGVRLPLSAQ
jgi:hypothetical protein